MNFTFRASPIPFVVSLSNHERDSSDNPVPHSVRSFDKLRTNGFFAI